jgi:hypothetical protein
MKLILSTIVAGAVLITTSAFAAPQWVQDAPLAGGAARHAETY